MMLKYCQITLSFIVTISVDYILKDGEERARLHISTVPKSFPQRYCIVSDLLLLSFTFPIEGSAMLQFVAYLASQSPTLPFFLGIDDCHFDRLHFPLTSDNSFDISFVENQPLACE